MLREEEVAPTGVRLMLPPESVSLVFNEENKIVKLVGGGMTVLDRTVGNSAGLGGMYGIAAALGRPYNPLAHTPPQKVGYSRMEHVYLIYICMYYIYVYVYV
jgi:hypothetical protein